MNLKPFIEQWITLFNQGDYEALSQLYAEDAINHQVAVSPVVGQRNIREMFRMEFKNVDMTCIPENIFQDKDWAILEWKDPNGLQGCGFFHIVDEKIVLQRGYWDMLSACRKQGKPLPQV